jgi:hypothetical protein
MMTEEQLDKIKRRAADQVLIDVPGGVGYEQRVLIAVEAAMNEEWWRGYYAGRKRQLWRQPLPERL